MSHGTTLIDFAPTAKPSTSHIRTIYAQASDVLIVPANATRKGLWIYNNSSATLYLAVADEPATSLVHSFPVPAGITWELPPLLLYTGPIHGFWSGTGGYAHVTEFFH